MLFDACVLDSEQSLYLKDTEKFVLFDACVLDFELMTLVLKLDLDIIVTYLHIMNEVKKVKWLKNYGLDTLKILC